MAAAHDDRVDVTGSHGSVQVALDLVGGPHRGLGRVATGLAQGAALPQQVPALIELHLEMAQPGVFFGLADLTVLELLAKSLLLGDEFVDP